MSEKLSERAARIGGFWMVEFAPEIAALEQQLAAKDAEITRLTKALEFYLHDPTTLNSHIARAALAETPAAPIPVCEMCGWVKAECVCTTKRCPCGVLGCSGTHLREPSETPAAPEVK